MELSLSKSDTSALKGIAICAMLWHHLFYGHPEFGTFVHQTGLIGKVCVAMFLFLSGYGLTVQYGKKGGETKMLWGGVLEETLLFQIRRFVKFYLNYWAVFIIFVPLGVFVFGRTLDIPYGEEANKLRWLVTDFLGFNGLQSYNITWWFNRFILIMYVLFPLLFLYFRKWWLALPVLLFFYFKYNVCFPFVLGMFVAMNPGALNDMLKKLHPMVVAALSVGIVVGLCFVRQLSPIPYTGGTYIDGFIAMFVASALCASKSFIKTGFPVLGYLGKHSMNIYLIHTFIFYYFFPDFCYSFKYPILIFLSLLLSSLAVSIVLEQLKTRCGLYKLQGFLLKKAENFGVTA